MIMSESLNIYGIFIPPFLFIAVGALLALKLLHLFLNKVNFYSFVYNRSLVDVALFFLISSILLYVLGGRTLLPLF